MKNSESYGVQEMCAKEMKNVDGGVAWYFILAAAITIGYAIESAVVGAIDGWNNPLK